MGLAGAGFGAAKTLEDLVAEQILKQRLTEEIRMREASLAEQQRSSQADEGMRSRGLDMQEQVLNAPKPAPRDPIADHRAIKQIDQEFMPAPKPVVDPLIEYEGKKKIDQQYDKPAAARDPIADYEAKKQIDQRYEKPAGVASPYAAERAVRTIDAATDLMGKVSRWNTGFGSLLANIPESEAVNFAAELDTLKSAITQGELAQMREASKTGGALGQVSDTEGRLLASSLGALNARQSPKNLKANLQKVIDSVERWQQTQGSQGGPTPVPSHGGAGPAPAAPTRLRFDAQGNPIKP